MILLKYGVEATIDFPIPKANDTDLAATGDWTPATGDTKISKDGGNFANTTNNPAAIGGSGSVGWSLTLTAAELTAARVAIQIIDAAVENQFILIQTYGHPSAQHAFDLDSSGDVLNQTTIATLASQTSFTLAAGSADDNAYNDCTIVIQDASTAAQKAIGIVKDYTGSTKTVTLLADPGIFPMAANDVVTILAPDFLTRYIAAICHGVVTGAGTGSEVFKGIDGTTRATVVVDASGNRSSVTYG